MINHESGRSMTEMLGVLAVVGILSVGGLYGYNAAMKMNEVNELLREVNFRANQVSTQLLLGAEPENVTDIESAFLVSGDYSFSAVKNPANSNQFKIVMVASAGKKIPEHLCRQAYLQLGNNSVIRAIGQATDFTSSDGCTGGLDTLSFVFNNDMSKGPSSGSNSGGGGSGGPTVGSSCTVEGMGICTDDVNIHLCTKVDDELKWTATVCDYGCKNGQCRSAECTAGDANYCFGNSMSMKCVDGSWQRTLCNWGCSDGVCAESCTTETNTRERTFNNGMYCMISTCQNGSWDNPSAFCRGGCSGCTGIDADALAEFRNGYPTNQH